MASYVHNWDLGGSIKTYVCRYTNIVYFIGEKPLVTTRKAQQASKAEAILKDHDPDFGPNHGFDPKEINKKAGDKLRNYLKKAEQDLSIIDVPEITKEELDEIDETIYIDEVSKIYPKGAEKLVELLKNANNKVGGKTTKCKF